MATLVEDTVPIDQLCLVASKMHANSVDCMLLLKTTQAGIPYYTGSYFWYGCLPQLFITIKWGMSRWSSHYNIVHDLAI